MTEAPRARVVLDLSVVARGVVAGLTLIVPVALLVSAFDVSTSLRVLGFFAILFAYATAGYGAARYRPDAPLAHGLVAGLGSYLVWLVLRLAVGAVRGEFGFGLPAAVINAIFAVSLGMIGGIVASRKGPTAAQRHG